MGQTRKIRKPTIKEETRERKDSTWERFIIEGDRLFAYMTSCYERLIDNDKGKIKHFYLRDDAIHDKGTQAIRDQYNKELEQELLIWIRNEHASGRLFQKDLWQPVCDSYLLTHMYLGYKKTFQFKHYVFQLVLQADCDLDDCLDCYLDDCYLEECTNGCTSEECVCMNHFSLAYLGWYVEGKHALQPYNKIVLEENHMLPEWYWNLK